jgi:cytochrome c-type biogenesis protein CcsB
VADNAMAALSDQLMLAAVLLYLVAMLGYAAEIAFGRRRGATPGAAESRAAVPVESDADVPGAAPAQAPAEASAQAPIEVSAQAPAEVSAKVLAEPRSPAPGLAGSAVQTAESARTGGAPETAETPETVEAGEIAGTGETAEAETTETADTADTAEAADRASAGGTQIDWGRFAVMITVFAWAAQLAQIVTRGVAAGRVPWGNMYEFASAIVFAAVTTYLIVLTRRPIRPFGVFVTLLSVLGLGVAAIWLYTDAGPLVPALRSYWIAIHVTLAITATGLLTLATIATVLYLVSFRYRPEWLPDRDVLDRIAHQTIMFAFPIWTLAITAGAIWADSAWGRYWGWDPKETWSFITWVGYAGYLHARATAGWRGKRAAAVALIAYGALMFNFFGVNFLISGLHSYAG